MTTTIFICGPRQRGGCTVPWCPAPRFTGCCHELTGPKAGQACGKGLCMAHGTSGLCPPHQRLSERAEAKGGASG